MHTKLRHESLKLLFLKGLSEEEVDDLDMIKEGDISKYSFEEICEAYKNNSRDYMKRVRSVRSRGGSATKTIWDISTLHIASMFNNMK